MVSDQKPVRNKLDAKQQNLYFQTIQIQWNSYLKLLRKQIMEAAQQSKKTIIFANVIVADKHVRISKQHFFYLLPVTLFRVRLCHLRRRRL